MCGCQCVCYTVRKQSDQVCNRFIFGHHKKRPENQNEEMELATEKKSKVTII